MPILRFSRTWFGCALAGWIASPASRPGLPGVADLPEVVANDNRTPAGHLSGDTLHLALEVRLASWHPEADDGPRIVAPVFAEAGGPPMVPGPLIRVTTGTIIDLTVLNTLSDTTITLSGLAARPARLSDTVMIGGGQTIHLRFPAGQPGTYLYRGQTADSVNERQQLGGALVVDSVGPARPDRVFVINIWGTEVDSVTYPNALAINGRSWPYTERITAAVGDSIRWRWVNASDRNHPMHLHGFFFRLLAHGDGLRDTVLAPGSQPLEVTEDMRPFSTADLVWSPDRDGNWLFHCHIGYHVLPGSATLEPMPPGSHDMMSGDLARHMAGLVLGISVAPRPEPPEVGSPGLHLRLYIQEGGPRGRTPRRMGFTLMRGSTLPIAHRVEWPSPVLVLWRGIPTTVTVFNRLSEPTSIHWHGLELGSYSDGVPGWSGQAGRTAPAIAPGDSFVATLQLARAGTFIYHTHLDDFVQLTAGMYGPIVVLEPGQTFDRRLDHVFTAGWDGPNDSPPHLVVNGDSAPPPMRLAQGTAHRLRLINIGVAGRIYFALTRDSAPASWRALALDGAALPPALEKTGPARTTLHVGQTADFEFTPAGPGRYRLEAGWSAKGEALWQQVLEVR